MVKISDKFAVGTAALRTKKNGDARALASNELTVLQSWPEILKAKNHSCRGSAANKLIPSVLTIHPCAGCAWFVQSSQSVIASPFLISCREADAQLIPAHKCVPVELGAIGETFVTTKRG
jgi:hypothetical protein